MLDKLDFMVHFWRLRARHAAAGEPLSSAEGLELLSLLQLMATDLRLPDPGPAPPAEGGLPVQLTAPGGFLAGELRLVCAEGLVVTAATALRPDMSTIVRLADALLGVEYTLPCVVVWSHVGAPSSMALRVDGAPARVDFAIPEPGMWRSPLPWRSPSLADLTDQA